MIDINDKRTWLAEHGSYEITKHSDGVYVASWYATNNAFFAQGFGMSHDESVDELFLRIYVRLLEACCPKVFAK